MAKERDTRRFLERRSIEVEREKWAAKIRAEFSEDLPDLVVLAKDKENYLYYPVLEPCDYVSAPSWVPRVEPLTGAIYTSRWEDDFILKSDDADRFIVIGGEQKGKIEGLRNTPKSWNITLLVPQAVAIDGGLEKTMRQADEIRHDYRPRGGVERARVERALSSIQAITEAFVKGEIKTEGDLNLLAQETEEMLKKEGLLSARSSLWKDLVDYTTRAAQKQGRYIEPVLNNPASRILLRGAYLRAVKRELKVTRVRMKAKRVYSYLERARGVTRYHVQGSIEELDAIAGFEKKRTKPLLTPSQPIDRKTALEISEGLKNVDQEHLQMVQAAPYLHPVTAARAILLGTFYIYKNEELEQFKATLRLGGFEDLLRPQSHSVEEHLRHLRGDPAIRGIHHAFSLLKSAFEDPERYHTQVY